jgi:predicted deacetylase
MVKCLLCPKRGGAMKPTNIFRSYEKYYEQKIKNLSKKTSKTNLGKLNVLTKENQNQILTK